MSCRPRPLTLLFALTVAAFSCARDPDEHRAPPVARTSDGHTAIAVVEALKSVRGLSIDFDARDSVRATVDGWSQRASSSSGDAVLQAILPRDARAPLRLSIEGDDALSIELVAQGSSPSVAQRVGAATVFVDATLDTDVIHVADGARIEELRWLRTARASTVTRYAMQLGEHVGAVRVVGEAIEVLDRRGVPRIVSAPMFAIDAAGTRRAVRPSLTGDREHLILETALDTNGLVFPIAIDPAWVATGDMVTGYRYLHGQVTLKTGKALIFGGYVPLSGAELSTAELYDPTTKTWSLTGTMIKGPQRMGYGMLPDGRVMVAGGFVPSAAISVAEIYDPTSGKWTSAASMHDTRDSPAMNVLLDGRVLIAGGEPTSYVTLSSAEIYTPSSDMWTVTTSMGTPRSWAAGALPSALLVSGKVLVMGGSYRTASTTISLSTAEVYDPATKTWFPTTTPMRGVLVRSIALPSGNVLAISTEGYTDLYDASTNAFRPAAASPIGSADSLTLLATGKVLAIAPATGKYAIYDPIANTWSGVGDVLLRRSWAGASRLPSGSVLVSGGGYLTTLAPLAEVFTQSANGATCAGDYECTSGFCTDGVCCSVASCGAGKSCNAGVPGACSKTVGTTCGAAGECGTGFCVDGVCCDVACTGVCSSCNTVGKTGTCSAISGAPVGGRAACGGAGVGTACAPFCNGTDGSKCSYAAAGATPCGSDSCASGVETHAGSCNGAGACATTTKACGVYACGTTACKTSCSVKEDCAAGYFCKAGSCAAVAGLGSTCSSPSECTGGTYCTDGVCCGVPSCGAGRSCNASSTPGTCATIAGAVCTADAECGSGFCTDGVCCDKRCDGRCEACDVVDKKGACTPVAGAPHGARAPCDDGGGDACKATTCDGAKDPKICAGFVNGPTKQCKPSTCATASYTAPSTCDGAGACATPAATSCFPYGCDEKGCLSACATAAQCADGADCRGGKCVSQGDTCSPDGLSSIAKGGAVTPCSPFLCGSDGKCIPSCGTSADCVAGATCNGEKLCIAATGGGSSGGGCEVGRGERAPYFEALSAIFALCVVGARRRRARGVGR